MLIDKRRPPQLRYDTYEDRWVLDLPCVGDHEYLYCMHVRYAYMSEEEGWSEFTFYRYDCGEREELVTQEEYDARLAAIREHEGDEIADLWDSEQRQVSIVGPHHPVLALRDYWNAMMTLSLFVPSVTLRQGQGNPVHRELREKMDAIRDRQMRETAEEMRGDGFAGEPCH